MDPKLALIAALIAITLFYFAAWWVIASRKRGLRGDYFSHQ